MDVSGRDGVGSPGEKDPLGRDPHAPGAKLDAGKARVWLMLRGFARALDAVADVTTKGAAKYTPDGWQDVPDGVDRYMDAFGRHMMKLGMGERIDPDTGCSHKAQMIWNLLASLELETRASLADWVNEGPEKAAKPAPDFTTNPSQGKPVPKPMEPAPDFRTDPSQGKPVLNGLDELLRQWEADQRRLPPAERRHPNGCVCAKCAPGLYGVAK